MVDPENPYVLANHLQAAAFELPLAEADVDRFGPLAMPIAGVLSDCGAAERSGRAVFLHRREQNPGSADQPAAHERQHVFDRAASAITLGQARDLQRDHEVIANVDAISAPELVYPEAVYLHNGETYFVRELDLEGKVAYVERREMDYYTQAVLETQRTDQAAAPRARARFRKSLLAYGDVDVTWQTVAFKKIKFGTRENIGLGPVDIPAQTLPTTALWLAPDDALRAEMKAAGYRTSEGDGGPAEPGDGRAADGGDVRQPRSGRTWSTARTWAARR